MSTAEATRAHCVGVVHVGEHGNFQAVADFREYGERRVEPEPARAF